MYMISCRLSFVLLDILTGWESKINVAAPFLALTQNPISYPNIEFKLNACFYLSNRPCIIKRIVKLK